MLDKLKKNPKLAVLIFAVIATVIFAIYQMVKSRNDKSSGGDSGGSNSKKSGMKGANPLESQISRILDKQFINTGINTAEAD